MCKSTISSNIWEKEAAGSLSNFSLDSIDHAPDMAEEAYGYDERYMEDDIISNDCAPFASRDDLDEGRK